MPKLTMTDTNPAAPRQPARHDHPGTLSREQSRLAPLHPAVHEELHYRQLEQTYYQSAQYAAMVERYPLLRSSIAACHSLALVNDAPEPAPGGTAHLQWERSHGEH
jgi:hypothetical protein